MKLDEKFELNDQMDPSIINNLNKNDAELGLSKEISNNSEIVPDGVSIENASYIESKENNTQEMNIQNLGTNSDLSESEEHTPQLFSDDNDTQIDSAEDSYSEQLFEDNGNDEEEFEIPAFLRKQKF